MPLTSFEIDDVLAGVSPSMSCESVRQVLESMIDMRPSRDDNDEDADVTDDELDAAADAYDAQFVLLCDAVRGRCPTTLPVVIDDEQEIVWATDTEVLLYDDAHSYEDGTEYFKIAPRALAYP